MNLLVHALVGLLPVCCFLAALVFLDSYKLVRMRWVLGTIGLGCIAGLLSYPLNVGASRLLDLEFLSLTRYVAPVIEEALKGLVIVLLIRRNRIGFPVDAAIFGFGVGAGIAIFENLYYLQAMPDLKFGTWIVRGFGTALMHGGATAIFAVVTHTLMGQYPEKGAVLLLPGFLVAVIAHSVYNHFFLMPIVNTLIVFASLPILFAMVFQHSEKSVRGWLGIGFDADAEIIELINSGDFSASKVGTYLQSLTEKFEGPVVVDMLCYLRLHKELAMRAKGLVMMREQGFMDKPGEETRAKLEELKYLESSIGPTGMLAMNPFLRLSQKDLWQIYMLSS
ncbi:MAG: PrsW family glutamic-type intramembrane protease [Woeseiaceae bacterium]